MEIREIQAEDTYDIRHKVMWADKPIDFVKIDEDTEGVHLGLFEDGLLTSIVSLFFKNDTMQFRKFATLMAYQGRGYGTALLKYAFQLAIDQGVTQIWCNARSNKSAFYEKFGMRKTDASYTKGGIEFVVMEMNF
jgi:predicted GNAT family N-acyltransferase